MPDDGTSNPQDNSADGSAQPTEGSDPSGNAAGPSQDTSSAPSSSPAQPADTTPAADPAAAQPADTSTAPADQPAQPADASSGAAQPADASTEPAGQPADASAQSLSAGRQNMLDLINKWMPTSLSQPNVPSGETQDLLALAGWTKQKGQDSKTAKDNGQTYNTSCGDVLGAMLTLWHSNFVGAFNIRDSDSTGKPPGAKGLGYYVDADGVQSPSPGDIIVLRNGFGPSSAGSVGHVGILVEAGTDAWRTADGGGGQLPDQTASVTTRTLRLDNNNIPILKSSTDGKEKQLDGWVDLDKLQQTG